MVATNLPALFLASFTAFLFLVLLFIVLIANSRSFLTRVFSLFLLCGFAWSLFAAFSSTSNTPQAENVANISLNILGLFPLVVIHFHFCLMYLGKGWKSWLFLTIPGYSTITYLMFTPYLTTVKDVPFEGGAGFHFRQQVGPLLYVPIFWGILVILILLFYLFRDLIKRRDDKIHLQKVKLLLFATFIGAIFTILYNSSPFFWAYPIDITGELIAAAILTYAILKFELVDVNTKLRNIIVELVFTSIMALSYLLFVLLLEAILGTIILIPAVILGIFLASFSQPLKERLLRFVDITFYRTRYDYRETINNFANNVGKILNFTNLLIAIKKTITETFGAREVHLFVKYKGAYRSLNSLQNVSFAPQLELIKFLTNAGRVLSWETDKLLLQKFPEIKRVPFELLIPLRNGNDLIGFLLIEKRLSGDFYSQEDKNLLFTLASSSSIAIKNSLLYEEVVEKNKNIEMLLAHEREVNESKDQFVAIASHFLRTPLTTIKGFLAILGDENLGEKERKDYVLKATNEQKKLASLVEDIISISSLEKGELKLYKTEVKLSSLVKKTIEDFTSLASEKGLTIRSVVEKELNVQADQQKLTQAISNLVNNAIKFTSVGSITLSLTEFEGKARIGVEDTGIGIEEEALKDIFQKFHRATSVQTYNYAGSGLGLYITKLIVDAHGGKVSIVSKIGTGTKFYIDLPL